ncbi:MAG: RHS repeat-associated core domain-containing protein [Rhodoferax sp.]|nr:RHS repeat-associated core domain-containing protein [Rhodoferax sp.]
MQQLLRLAKRGGGGRPPALARWCARMLAIALAGVATAGWAQDLVRTTAFTYDRVSGQVKTETVDPDGTHCVQTVYEHDGYGNRSKVTVQPCASTTARFAPRVTVNTFAESTGAAAGNNHPAGAYLTKVQTGTLNGTAFVTLAQTQASYDTRFGQANSSTQVALAPQAAGRDLTTRAEFDSLGRQTKAFTPVHRDPSSATGAVTENFTETKTYYCQGTKVTAANPAPAACINLSGLAVNVNYLSRRLLSDASGQTTLAIRSAYFVEHVLKDAGGNAIGARARVHFDSLHREIAKESETFDGKWSRTLTGFDALGMAAATWGPHVVASANELPPEEVKQWTQQRDLLHRPLETAQWWRGCASGAAACTNPTPQVVVGRAQYQGLSATAVVPAESTTDNQERRRTTHKNGAGQVAQTVDAYGATLNLAYDAFGNLVRTRNALGHETTITYTPTTARFKTGMVDPDRGEWHYTYDALGQLKTQRDGNLNVTTLEYDAMGRTTLRQTPSLTARWKYSLADDGTNQCPQANGLPRLCKSWTGNDENNPSTLRQPQYDALGRVAQVTEKLDIQYTSVTTYDAATGRPAKFKYPSGLTLRYSYNARGFLTAVADDADAARKFWSVEGIASPYDARGNLVKAQVGYGAGAVSSNHEFDAISGKALLLRAGLGGSSNNVLNHAYTYDKLGNVASRSAGFGGGTERFSHDLLDRLVSYTVEGTNAANRTVSVAYNAIGNILSKSDVGDYRYDGARPHAATTIGTVGLAYDGNGNVFATGGTQVRSHQWTDFNLPHTLQYGANKVRFWYDDQLKRVQEITTSGSTERRLWLLHPDNAGGLSFEREETLEGGVLTRNESRHYVSVGGVVVAVIKTLNATQAGAMATAATVPADGRQLHYWQRDSLGSVVAVSDGTGQVLERPGFDPWGRRLLEDRALDTRASGPAHGDRGFTGHEHLDELGLVHMNGRVYEPGWGRFLSPDPVNAMPEDLQSYNTYSYVINGPLRYTDPSGHCIFGLDTAVCVAMFVAGTAMAMEGNKYWSMVGMAMAGFALMSPSGLLAEAGLGQALATAGITGWSATAVTGAIGGGIMGFIGSGGDINGLVMGAFFGAAFGAIGGSPLQGYERVVAHAFVGCIQGEVTGGGCGPSAMAAALGKAVTEGTQTWGLEAQFVATTLAGGTASVIGGGKFRNGALQAGFGYLFNALTSGETSNSKGASGEDLRRQELLGRGHVVGETLFEQPRMGYYNAEGKLVEFRPDFAYGNSRLTSVEFVTVEEVKNGPRAALRTAQHGHYDAVQSGRAFFLDANVAERLGQRALVPLESVRPLFIPYGGSQVVEQRRRYEMRQRGAGRAGGAP